MSNVWNNCTYEINKHQLSSKKEDVDVNVINRLLFFLVVNMNRLEQEAPPGLYITPEPDRVRRGDLHI